MSENDYNVNNKLHDIRDANGNDFGEPKGCGCGEDCLCEENARADNCGCGEVCGCISRKDEETVLHDIDKTLLTAIQSTDEVLNEISGADFKEYLKKELRVYSEMHNKCSEYMRKNGIESNFYGSMKQAMQKGAVKLNLVGGVTDGKIANMMIKGGNMGLDVIAKNLNKKPEITDELYKMARALEAELTKSINEMRRFL